MHVFKEFDIETILPFIPDKYTNKVLQTHKEFNGFRFKVVSQRLVTFKYNLSCVCCGIAGNKFVLETAGFQGSPGNDKPHLNLYANWTDVANRKSAILMTKDHVKAYSRGGESVMSNYQTMCTHCNCLKDKFDVGLELLRAARCVLNETKSFKQAQKFLRDNLNETQNKQKQTHTRTST